MRQVKNATTMPRLFNNPSYRGKHVVLAAGRIYTSKTGAGVKTILRKLEKTHPRTVPEIAYLPKARSMILWM